MRAAFAHALCKLADADKRICLLTGDLGFMVLEDFAQKNPDRFFNMGAAEQNMIGTAVGLAEAGFIPFVYSIATFATLRAYEFVRNGAVMHHLPVRLVGIGGGFEYGANGLSHYGLEDLAVMRVQPGMSVMAPADSRQTEKVLEQTWALSGPIYYRLSKNDQEVPGLNGQFEVGRAQLIGSGQDVLLISVGAISLPVAEAAGKLRDNGISAAQMIVASIAPTPVEDLLEALRHFRLVVCVEEHYVNGGLGSLVCELVAENGLRTRVIRQALNTVPDGIIGSQPYLTQRYGLSAGAIVDRCLEALSATTRA